MDKREYELEFGRAYQGLAKNVVENLQVIPHYLSEEWKCLEEVISENVEKIRENVPEGERYVKDYLEEMGVAKDEYHRADEYSLPTFYLTVSALRKIGKMNATGCATSQESGLAVIFLANYVDDEVKGSLIHHEGQHIIFPPLYERGIISQGIKEEEVDRRDFKMFKNEVLSTILGNQKPHGYTYHNLIGKHDLLSPRVREKMIKINELFWDNFHQYGDPQNLALVRPLMNTECFEEIEELVTQEISSRNSQVISYQL